MQTSVRIHGGHYLVNNLKTRKRLLVDETCDWYLYAKNDWLFYILQGSFSLNIPSYKELSLSRIQYIFNFIRNISWMTDTTL